MFFSISDRGARLRARHQADFEAAAALVKTFENLSNADLGDLYKYYKQATVGDINIGSRAIFSLKFQCFCLGIHSSRLCLDVSFAQIAPACSPWTSLPRASGMPGTASRVRSFALFSIRACFFRML
jgi:hypothetical protein